MTHINHQTIKLGRGKHASPEAGACVMELASMLAGERFSDHPKSVSRVLAAFLRGYNDLLGDERRQDLYAYASMAVGTAAGSEVEAARIARVLAWAEGLRSRGGRSLARRLFGPRLARTRRDDPEAVGSYAVRLLRQSSDADHSAALALADELIRMSEVPSPELPTPSPRVRRVAVTSARGAG